MTIAIVIAMHGLAAEQLFKTAEMLLGKQKNIEWVDFVPGENTETLIKKYQTQIKKLDILKGILFLVDTWGGSPFNAASHIVVGKENHDVISGVNIPMLLETLMARDDDPTFDKLVSIAVETGREGIKTQKKQFTDTTAPVQPLLSTQLTPDEHMKIVLVRIDDRLIHGQVATRWTRETNVSRIIVVSDEVAKDQVRKTLLSQVAPPGVSAHVVDIDKMVRVWNNPKYSQDRVMLLFTNPTDVLRIVEQGVEIKSVNIGGMAFCQGKIQVNNAISVDAKDIAAFHKLNELNIELEVRKVSNDPKLDIIKLIAKVNS
ncbi:PTS mannose transporter subunit IIAB [Pantoea sp. Nvir]|uniref:PTS mannose transporter subunit IIAB n=1 Tax=Pantoea sp. Nvir TaxID=2576760 RepID=UPI00135B1CD4|nr:PTS mannose transporter subunit IIAB [Pantoea sp. Nvir]MXP66673.1 PTS mannose transporter subunit IIAB [Pantoea sp. Nvir]CAJ0991881.1 PTS system mannose-specific EIIAB component [Pantoea sp. Nvir]